MKQNDFIRETDGEGNERIVVSNRPRRKLDIIPRLICVVFALIIWLYCVNINENDVVATYTVKIETTGSFADGVSIYDDRNVSEVKITVQGSNRDINKYTASDYKAYVDVSKIHKYGWSSLDLEIVLPGGSQSTLSLLSSDIDSIEVYADISATKEIPIMLDETGFTRSPNYTYDIKYTDKLSITGPKTVVDTIAAASIILNGESTDTSTLKTGPGIKFLGESLATSDVIVSNLVMYDPGKVSLNIGVSGTKSVSLEGVGISSDYSCVFDVATVNIVGDPKLLEHISECSVQLQSTEGIFPIDLTSEMLGLPDGVKLQTENISVVATVTKIQASAVQNNE